MLKSIAELPQIAPVPPQVVPMVFGESRALYWFD